MIAPGKSGDNAVNSTLEFFKNIWSGVPGMVVPTLSVEELDKKIADMKIVESWLTLNMNMLRSSIQALEVQRAPLATLRSMGTSFDAAMRTAAQPEAQRAPAEEPAAGMPPLDLASQFGHATAWWNALQNQFHQAVDKVMKEEAAAPAAAAKAKPAAAPKPAVKKPAAPKK